MEGPQLFGASVLEPFKRGLGLVSWRGAVPLDLHDDKTLGVI